MSTRIFFIGGTDVQVDEPLQRVKELLAQDRKHGIDMPSFKSDGVHVVVNPDAVAYLEDAD